MLKKLVLLTLCLCIVLSACFGGGEPENNQQKIEDHDELLGEEQVEDDPDTDEVFVQPNELQMISGPFSTIASTSRDFSLKLPSYEANVEAYSIEDDFSNVINFEQFSGFTAEQLAMLQENGFVVLPSTDTKMFYVYDQNEYLGIPNFITIDSLLHTFHHFYNKALMHIESAYLFEDLQLMTEQMLEKSLLVLDILEDKELKALQRKNIAYFLVAQMLLDPAYDLGDIEDNEVVQLAEKELELIEQADTFTKSPLFQLDLDYSQFTVRGHYTRSEQLAIFFKVMMWYGTAPNPFYDRDGYFIYENTLQVLLLTYTAFVQHGEHDDPALWLNIYEPTSLFVGLSDDIHLLQMNALRLEVFGEGNDPNIFNDASLSDDLERAVDALPGPKIQGKFTSVSTPTKKQFRLMGQRYIMDSFIMQELMEPFVRPVPSALDVMGVLDSNLAEHLLLDIIKPQERWPDYESVYRQLKDEVSQYGEDIWGSNLYNGWLWTIQEALTEYEADSGMPKFMTNDAWKGKSLNTALGSYTELKHDTVLYGKQPAAQMGGSIEYEYAKYHYVEPNIPLYGKLLYLTDELLTILDEFDMLEGYLLQGANQYKELLELMIACSIKQLRNEPLSDEQRNKLLWFGGELEHISLTFLSAINDDSGGGMPVELSDMLVTDVATIAPNEFVEDGSYLALGTGFFDHIYVLVPADDQLVLARGSVYSYYEFVSKKRLTDEEWWEMNGLLLTEEYFGQYLMTAEPSEDMPAQPFWVDRFKSHSNDVSIQYQEVDWSRLNE